MKAQEVDLAVEEVEKAGEEQATIGEKEPSHIKAFLFFLLKIKIGKP